DEDVASIMLTGSASPLGEDVASIVVSLSASPPDEGVASVVVVSASTSSPAEGVSLIVGSVSVSFDVPGDGFITVVLLFLFSAGGLILVCFCSQPTNNATPAAMSMYFLID